MALFNAVFASVLFLSRCFGIASGVAICYLLLSALYNITLHPLASYPGPKRWAASNVPFVIAYFRGLQPYETARLHEKYGPVVRVAPNHLDFTGEDASNDIFASRPQLKKEAPQTMFKNGPSSGILTVESDEDHARMRRNFSHSFSDKALREQEPLITRYFDLFIQKLHENSHSPIDLTHWYNLLSFDVIGDLTFGESFKCLEDSSLHVWVESIFTRVKTITHFRMISRLSPLDKILPLLIPKKSVDKVDIHKQFLDVKLGQRFSMKDSRPDFHTHVQKSLNTPTGMTYEEVRATASILIQAGSETTASTLTGLTFHLLDNPSKLSKLTQEIRSTFSSESEITMTSVNTLQYELACINEGLRMFPPVPNGFLNRVTPSQGAFVCGKFVPGNIMVSANQWATNRSTANFHLPSSFIPERWLHPPDSTFSNDKFKAVQPFSAGPRNCLGRNLASAEIRVAIARLLWNFDLELCEESKHWADYMKVFAFWQKPSLMCRLRKVVR